MSIYSDYAHGCMTDEEFRSACAYENRRERYYDEADSYDGLLEYYEEEEEDPEEYEEDWEEIEE